MALPPEDDPEDAQTCTCGQCVAAIHANGMQETALRLKREIRDRPDHLQFVYLHVRSALLKQEPRVGFICICWGS